MKLFARCLLMIIFLMIFLICVPSLCHAQIGQPCDYNDPFVPCPIDGGVTALLAAGVIYGIKKYKGAKKNEIQPVIDDD